ncbi:glucose 1-dehydrogenase [Leptolyngbya sp. NK1-12]|uniref:Glucose 1-dehydrogenase n=1 Tax=Leptolyngbya sp. NK1-12 TaxID=2547451 RepID=A0AA97AE32_9CYAN|nr:glucose 1-dehydrogenase [Leptolyngbya sp. NK1-12]WNZ21555.1 glucose 1-dehydrogenase [Leptolyngbya sp. NK1-12]
MEYNLFDLSGKVAIVTGSGRGLGAAMAQGLAAHQAQVVVCDRDLEAAHQVAQSIQSTGGTAAATFVDVTSKQSCGALIQFAVSQFGSVNILVNNAGIDIIKPAIELAEAEWDKILDVNLKGQFLCAQAAAKQMMHQGQGGSIIFISSIASVVGITNLVAYSAAKGGINQLTRVMALEWAAQKIRVNAIAPGYFENIMQGAKAEHNNPEKQQQIATFTPLKRRGQPQELVGPVVFLASDASSYVTGTVLYVDGGYTAI